MRPTAPDLSRGPRDAAGDSPVAPEEITSPAGDPSLDRDRGLGVLPPPRDVGWQTAFDFDQDGKSDAVEVAYSGGGHCCYHLAVKLSSTGGVTRFPFNLDGGYTMGLDFSAPEHFIVAPDMRGRPVIHMEIETYNGNRRRLPRAWRARYRISTNFILIHYERRKWIVQDDPSAVRSSE